MEVDWLGAIATNSARLAALAAAGPDRPVPACPEWTARDLLVHLAEVQRFWAATTARGGAAPVAVPEAAVPPDDHLAEFAANATAALLDAFRAAGPDARTWVWWADGRPVPVAHSMRRQAHEALIHRVDAEQACGQPSHLDPGLAADGVLEWLEWHSSDVRLPEQERRRVQFRATDTSHRWLLELGDHRPRLVVVDGPADATVTATAAELDLLVWRRIGLDGSGSHGAGWIGVSGDRALVEHVLAAADLT